MARAELKTRETSASVNSFLNGIADERQRADSLIVVGIMQRITGETPKMWGTSIIGFGTTTLKYASGRELDWMKIGFSPRKGSISLYLNCSLDDLKVELQKFGKHKTGKGCIYVKTLADVNQKILERMIKISLKQK